MLAFWYCSGCRLAEESKCVELNAPLLSGYLLSFISLLVITETLCEILQAFLSVAVKGFHSHGFPSLRKTGYGIWFKIRAGVEMSHRLSR